MKKDRIIMVKRILEGKTPNEIKKALTGYGSAGKPQMQEMVRVTLGLEKKPRPDDAADALAAAITHSLMKGVGNDGGN